MHKFKSDRFRWLIHALVVLTTVLALLPSTKGQGVDINDTRLLAQPAISHDHIAFIYTGDLGVGSGW